MKHINRVMHILGIDPGVAGGIALLKALPTGGTKVVDVQKWDGEDTFLIFMGEYHELISHCFVEKVHGTPVQTAGRAFTFGYNAGFIKGVLQGIGLDVTLVGPQQWQGPLNLPVQERTAKGKTKHKNNLKDKARELWPKQRWTHAIADAALIANHGINTLRDAGKTHPKINKGNKQLRGRIR